MPQLQLLTAPTDPALAEIQALLPNQETRGLAQLLTGRLEGPSAGTSGAAETGWTQ